jgi:hypothetical protein
MESMECHNNAFFRTAGAFGGVRIYSDSLSEPINTVAFAGTNNWIPTGSTFVPTQWTNTITGASPGVANAVAFDFTPIEAGSLFDAGNPAPATIPAHPFPNPHFPPVYHPPQRMLMAVGSAQSRPVHDVIDIGALEFAPVNTCPADVSPPGAGGDNVVNIDDLLMIINNWGASGPPGTVAGDVSGNGLVNIDDLLVVINAWGDCP